MKTFWKITRQNKFAERGSRWKIDLTHTIRFDFYGFHQLKGLGIFIELPAKLIRKRACEWKKNQYNKYFKSAMLSVLSNVDRTTDRLSHCGKHENTVEQWGFEHPMFVITDLQKFAD